MEIHEAASEFDRIGPGGYQPIENYGIIGDLHTTALVGMDGSIDWLCLPHHDSPSVFAAILDSEKGGRFKISPVGGEVTTKQLYWPDTNVLVTRFFTPDGVGEVTDYMPIGASAEGRHRIIRRVEVVRGTMTFRMECTPAFDYAREEHETRIVPGGVTFASSDLSLGLASFIPLQQEDDGSFAGSRRNSPRIRAQGDRSREGLRGMFLHDGGRRDLHADRRVLAPLALQVHLHGPLARDGPSLGPDAEVADLRADGAIVALPWDCPKASAESAIGTTATPGSGTQHSPSTGSCASGSQKRQRVHKLAGIALPEVQSRRVVATMYGIDGRQDLREVILDHLDGTAARAPSGSGTAPTTSCSSISTANSWTPSTSTTSTAPPSPTTCGPTCRALINWVCDNWQNEDEGIWETRAAAETSLYSRLMCWVAIDRGLRLADKRSFPADRDKWLKVGDEIYEEIMEKGWSPEREASCSPTATTPWTPRT